MPIGNSGTLTSESDLGTVLCATALVRTLLENDLRSLEPREATLGRVGERAGGNTRAAGPSQQPPIVPGWNVPPQRSSEERASATPRASNRVASSAIAPGPAAAPPTAPRPAKPTMMA